MSVYALVNATIEKEKKDMEKLWNTRNECADDVQDDAEVILLGIVNTKTANKKRGRCVEEWETEGRNENGDQLVRLCAEKELATGQ